MEHNAISERRSEPVAMTLGAASSLEVDMGVYELDGILRACYKFTERCYLFLARAPEDASFVTVTFMAKKAGSDLADIVGEFCNELLDQQLRLILAREAGPIREILFAQAFAEGNLLDLQRDEGDYQNDPLGIGQRR